MFIKVCFFFIVEIFFCLIFIENGFNCFLFLKWDLFNEEYLYNFEINGFVELVVLFILLEVRNGFRLVIFLGGVGDEVLFFLLKFINILLLDGGWLGVCWFGIVVMLVGWVRLLDGIDWFFVCKFDRLFCWLKGSKGLVLGFRIEVILLVGVFWNWVSKLFILFGEFILLLFIYFMLLVCFIFERL